MRVIAGKARGMKLKTIEGLDTRPTIDRIKETLFNIIAFDLPEAKVLDIFAGSGAIGIEALSRGAAQAVFVESNPSCVQVIRENLLHTKLSEWATVLPTDMQKALSALKDDGESFDIIFMDPPYDSDLAQAALQEILTRNLIKPEGFIVVESGTGIALSFPKEFLVFREKTYKTTTLTFLRLEDIV